MARYKRMRGFDVHYLTGTDEHGQKIQKKAEELNVTPQHMWIILYQELKNFGRSWISLMMILFVQLKIVIKMLLRKSLNNYLDQGDIYLDEYEGWYSVHLVNHFLQSIN